MEFGQQRERGDSTDVQALASNWCQRSGGGFMREFGGVGPLNCLGPPSSSGTEACVFVLSPGGDGAISAPFVAVRAMIAQARAAAPINSKLMDHTNRSDRICAQSASPLSVAFEAEPPQAMPQLTVESSSYPSISVGLVNAIVKAAANSARDITTN